MFLFGKRKQRLIAFAKQTAEELYSTVPEALVAQHLSNKSKQATKKFDAAVNEALMRIAQFKDTEKPGIYGKAKLHQIFAFRLKELGYPEEIADDINTFILTKTP